MKTTQIVAQVAPAASPSTAVRPWRFMAAAALSNGLEVLELRRSPLFCGITEFRCGLSRTRARLRSESK
jgi:hypothetical protein